MKTKMLVAALTLFAGGSIFAAEPTILVTGASAKSGSTALSLDIASDGNASAFSLIMSVPGVSDKSVDLSSCTGGLPKGWEAVCSVKNGELRVGGFAGVGASKLPAGVAAIGEVRMKGLSGSPSLSQVEIGDSNGNVISTASSVDVK